MITRKARSWGRERTLSDRREGDREGPRCPRRPPSEAGRGGGAQARVLARLRAAEGRCASSRASRATRLAESPASAGSARDAGPTPESGRRPGEETGSIGVCCGLCCSLTPEPRLQRAHSAQDCASPWRWPSRPALPGAPPRAPSHLPRAGAGAVPSAAPRTGAFPLASPAVQSQAPGPAVSECRSWVSPSAQQHLS